VIHRPFVRLAFAACLVAFLPSAAFAAMQYRLDADSLAPLSGPTKVGARLQVDGVPLVNGEPETLELERFEVWAPNAEIKVFGANETLVEKLAPPAAHYYRGRVVGDAESLVFLSVDGDRVEGLIYTGDRKFGVGSRLRSRKANDLEVVIEESSVLDDVPLEGGFTCGVEKMPLSASPGLRPRAVSDASGVPVSNVAPTGTQRSVINLAVDTDFELYTKAGSAANITTFIGNLIGAASTIYQRDLFTEIRISYLGIQNNVADPFLIVPGDTFAALLELGDRWHNSPPSANPRSATTLISGKSLGAGIAWVNTLCDSDSLQGGHWAGRYSYCGGITPPQSLAVPNPDANPNYQAPSSNYWPLLELTHELGHNVGSSHSHCVALTPTQKTTYGVTRNFVDECYSGEAGCSSAAQVVPAEKGSIMSYCHLIGGGLSTRFTFGQPGQTSEVILNNMRGYMANVTPALSAITAPASLGASVTGAASVTNAGLTYTWTIVNGTFTGGGTTATGAAVSFAGTVDPVTLTVTGTNANGCAVTDSRAVTIGSGPALGTPGSFTATATSASNVALSWTAASGATGYEILRSTLGQTFAPIATTAALTYNDTTAVAGTAYLYRVRGTQGATTGPASNFDLATAVAFTDPAITATTTAKLAHINELLSAVNAVRTLAGLPAIAFVAPAPAASGIVRATHIASLRTGLTAARTALALSTVSYTDPTITTATTVKAVHVTQLRNGMS
jgi:hypothetical protein